MKKGYFYLAVKDCHDKKQWRLLEYESLDELLFAIKDEDSIVYELLKQCDYKILYEVLTTTTCHISTVSTITTTTTKKIKRCLNSECSKNDITAPDGSNCDRFHIDEMEDRCPDYIE